MRILECYMHTCEDAHVSGMSVLRLLECYIHTCEDAHVSGMSVLRLLECYMCTCTHYVAYKGQMWKQRAHVTWHQPSHICGNTMT